MTDMNFTATSTTNTICLSIVVPIYNVSAFLGKCIDSLIRTAGIERTEIILVDDGSTDDSGTIADSYAEKYSYISSYHKENGGLSDARNYGLALAKGRYVFFCDSDDMVISESFGKVLTYMLKSDAEVILWNGVTVDENDECIDSVFRIILTHEGMEPNRVISGVDALIEQIKDHGKYAMTAWLKACNREFLLSNKVLFDPGLIHEDELWTPKLLLCASRVIYLKETAYCYRIRKNSIMESSLNGQEAHAQALVYIMNSLYQLYKSHSIGKKSKFILLDNWANTYMWEIVDYDLYKYECRKNIVRFDLLCEAKGFKNKIKGLMLFLFGFKTFCAFFTDRRKARMNEK